MKTAGKFTAETLIEETLIVKESWLLRGKSCVCHRRNTQTGILKNTAKSLREGDFYGTLRCHRQNSQTGIIKNTAKSLRKGDLYGTLRYMSYVCHRKNSQTRILKNTAISLRKSDLYGTLRYVSYVCKL